MVAEYVAHWQMSFALDVFDFSLDISRDSSEQGNASESRAVSESRIVSTDKYEHRDRILTKSMTLQSIDLQRHIPNAELVEEFAREYEKMTDKLHKK